MFCRIISKKKKLILYGIVFIKLKNPGCELGPMGGPEVYSAGPGLPRPTLGTITDWKIKLVIRYVSKELIMIK